MMFRIIPSPPCIMLSNTLIFADPHLGLSIVGYKLSRKSEVSMLRGEVDSIVQPILSLKVRLKKIIILGDIKDPLGLPKKTIREAVYYFFYRLQNIADDIIIVRGNHDGRLASILDEYHINASILNFVSIKHKGKTALLGHGHMKLPHEKIIGSDYIFIGHVHPASSLGEKSWIFSRFSIVTNKSRPDTNNTKKHTTRLIIFPSSNPRLIGTVISSRESVSRILSRIIPREYTINIHYAGVFDNKFNLIEIL